MRDHGAKAPSKPSLIASANPVALSGENTPDSFARPILRILEPKTTKAALVSRGGLRDVVLKRRARCRLGRILRTVAPITADGGGGQITRKDDEAGKRLRFCLQRGTRPSRREQRLGGPEVGEVQAEHW